MIQRKAIDIYRELLSLYGCAYNLDDGKSLRQHLKDGTPIPDHLLPGQVVINLSPEDREELKKLTSDDITNERIL